LEGIFSEWEHFKALYDHGKFKYFQVRATYTDEAGKVTWTTIDFMTTSGPLEVKNVEPSWIYNDKWLDNLREELIGCKEEILPGEEVGLSFYRSLGTDDLAYLESRLRSWFGDISWLKIYNGFDEFLKSLEGS